MLIPGPRLNTVFASRWKALAWAGGVLLTAYCSVPARQDSPPAARPVHVNPWAVDRD